MKLKYDFEYLNIDDETIMVPIGKNAQQVHGIIKLNDTGRIIVDLLQQNKNEDDIIMELSTKYDNGVDSLKHYVRKVITVFQEQQLIEEV